MRHFVRILAVISLTACGQSKVIGSSSASAYRYQIQDGTPTTLPPVRQAVGIHVRQQQWDDSTFDIFYKNGFVDRDRPSFDSFEYTVDGNTPNFAPTTYFNPWKLIPLKSWANKRNVEARAIYRFTRRQNTDATQISTLPNTDAERAQWVDTIWTKMSMLFPDPSDPTEHIVAGYNEPSLGFDPNSLDPEISTRPERHAKLTHAWIERLRLMGRTDIKIIEPSIHNVVNAFGDPFTYLARYLAALPSADLAYIKIGVHTYAPADWAVDESGVIGIKSGFDRLLALVKPYGITVQDIWVNEFGGAVATHPIYSLGHQSIYLVKTFKTLGIPLSHCFVWAEASDATSDYYIFGDYGNALKEIAKM